MLVQTIKGERTGWMDKNAALPKTTGPGSALIVAPVDVCPETDGVPASVMMTMMMMMMLLSNRLSVDLCVRTEALDPRHG